MTSTTARQALHASGERLSPLVSFPAPKSASLPYPGLRALNSDESHIFFGREQHTDELLARLDRSRFLAVVGPSGCGKSSLVRAGMIAGLETGFMSSAGTRWRVATLRPGSHPLRRLAAALVESPALGPTLGEDPHAQARIFATLTRGPLGLVEVLRETPLDAQTNLLVVVDQFEELFRFHAGRGSNEAQAFVALLLESARQDEVRIYVVMTMASDFLGDCARFAGLPERMNDSQYLTPRLTREQRQAAIEGPAKVFGGEVEPALVNAILNDMGSDPDQLPLMQHVLMRMWIEAGRGARQSDGRGLPPVRRTLTLQAYEGGGRLRERLSKDADEAFDELSETQQAIASVMFRLLTERGRQSDVRRPATIGEVAAVAGVSPENYEQVVDVVEAFRRPDRSFLTPLAGEPLYDNTVIDISHESLIRQWHRLSDWVKDEANCAWQYGRLREQADLWASGRGGYWRTPDLETGLAWKKNSNPTPEWAKRYGGDFDKSMRFLDASQQEQTRGHRRKIATVSLAFAAIVLLAGVAVIKKVEASREGGRAELRAVLNQGFKDLEEDPERSLLLALHVADNMRLSDTDGMTEEMTNLLHRAVQASRVRLTVHGSDNPIQDLAYSSDGRRIGVAGVGRAAVLDARSGATLFTLPADVDDLSAIQFSPDGQHLVTAGLGGAADVWNALTGRRLARFMEHRGSIGRVAFGARDSVVATASADSTVMVWNLNGTLRVSLRHDDVVWGVAFSPNGGVIATGSHDGAARTWNSVDGRLIRTFADSADGVVGVVFSPGGERLVTGSRTGRVRIWDVATGRAIQLLRGHSDVVWDLAFHPDGVRLATASYDGTVRLWNSRTGALLVTRSAGPDTIPIRALAFSPDGSELAMATAAGRIHFWGLSSGDSLRSHAVTAASARLRAIAVSPDGTVIVTAGNGMVAQLWDADLGTPLGTLRDHWWSVNDVEFSRDGSKVVTGSRDGRAIVWDIKTGKPLTHLTDGHEGSVLAVAFAGDAKRVVTTGTNGKAVVWNAVSGDSLFSLNHRRLAWARHVWAVAYSPDGRSIATGGEDGNVKLWRAADGALIDSLYSADSRLMSDIVDVAFSPDGRLIAAAQWQRQTVEVWNRSAPRQTSVKLVGHSGPVVSVAFSPDGNRIASGSNDRTIRIWDARTGRELFRLLGHTDPVWDVAFTPDGDHVVSASWDGTWRLWDIASNSEFGSLNADSGFVNQVEYTADGRRLATIGSEVGVKLWDARTGEASRTIDHNALRFALSPDSANIALANWDAIQVRGLDSDALRAELRQGFAQRIVFSQDGRRIATLRDSLVRVWNASTGTPLDTLNAHNRIRAMAFHPKDSTRLAIGGTDMGFVWSVASGKKEMDLYGHMNGIRDVAFDTSGKLIATGGGDGTIRLWSRDSVFTFKGQHTSAVSRIAFSPDSRSLASSSADGTAKMWDVRTGTELFTVAIGAAATWLTFSPDGNRIAVASSDGKVRFYGAALKELLALARTRATRSLTAAECLDDLHVAQCPTSILDDVIRGRERAHAGDTSRAASMFEAAVRKDPRLKADRGAGAEYLKTQGEIFALKGDVLAAAATLRAAKRLNPRLELEPVGEATRAAASFHMARARALGSGNAMAAAERRRRAQTMDPVLDLLVRGRAFAEAGNFDSATVLLRLARSAAPRRDFVAEAQLVASHAEIVARGAEDRIEKAISLYDVAAALDSSQISAEKLNLLCWSGTLWGHARLVLAYCDRAVVLAPDSSFARDSRGLARAVSGHTAEAISDFEVAVFRSSDHSFRLVRQMWVASLRAGKTPFTPQVLEAMRLTDAARSKDALRSISLNQRAIQLYPAYLMAYWGLARSYGRRDDTLGVRRTLRALDRVGLTYRQAVKPMVVYRGVLKNNDVPEPASFEIRFEKGEPEPSGILLVGDPLYGSGPFNGVWKGDSLIIWSTAATGDTIRWATRPTSRGGLSGTYKIVGGMAEDQGGVFETTLMEGPPVATLRSAPPTVASGPAGTWSGEWSDKTSSWTLDMIVKLGSDKTARGAMVWTLKSAAREETRIGASGTEYFAGTYDPQTRTLMVSGYAKEDTASILGTGSYTLTLSADEKSLSGDGGNEAGVGRLSARRKP